MKTPTSITFDNDGITVDGVQLPFRVIPQMLYELVHPDPRKWFCLERMGNVIHISVKFEEKKNGTEIATIPEYAANSGEGFRS